MSRHPVSWARGVELTAIGSSLVFTSGGCQKRASFRTRHGAIPEGLGAVRSLDRPRPQVRSFLDGFFRKVAGRRRDGIHKSVSELSVNVDGKLAGKEPE